MSESTSKFPNSRALRLWAGVLALWCITTAQSPITFKQSAVVLETAAGRYDFKVEMASNDAERSRGLMYRTELAPDRGMLFDFKRDIYVSMWMKNTLIPLDMLFADKTGRIVYIKEMAVPGSLETIQPPGRARAVLEVAGGTVARLGVKLGDLLKHEIFR